MSNQDTDGNGLRAGRSPADEADHSAAVGEIISEKSDASRPQSDDGYPPSRPRRGCEEC